MSDDTINADRNSEQRMNMLSGKSVLIRSETEPDSQTTRIRDLNDKFRTTGLGGKVMLTRGIVDLDPDLALRVLEAVKGYDDFSPDNDPWDERDCASLTVDETRIIWKIDYYERSGRIHSPDPADAKVTLRVLTVMLADEY